MSIDVQREFCFGPFVFNIATLELSRNGVRLPLEPQPAMLLAQLVSRAGEVVERGELAERLWGASGTHVSVNDGLNYCVRQVRAVLADDSRSPMFVATVPRRGYQFVAPVTTAANRRGEIPRRRSPRVARWAPPALAALALVLVIESRPNDHHAMAGRLLRAVHDLLY